MRKPQMILCLVGLAVSLYLALTAYSCFGAGCSVVHLSPYARVMGVPVAWIGVVGYSLLLVAYWRRVFYVELVVIAGAILEIYFVVVQTVFIEEYCIWCMISAIVMFSIFILEFKWKAAALTGVFLLAMGMYTAAGMAVEPVDEPMMEVIAAEQPQEVTLKVSNEISEPPKGAIFYEAETTLYDRGGRSMSISKDTPLLIFHPACSHCREPIKTAAALPEDKRPVLVLAVVWDESTWDEAEAKAKECGFPDPVYTGIELPRDQILPVLMIGEQVITGDKRITQAISSF